MIDTKDLQDNIMAFSDRLQAVLVAYGETESAKLEALAKRGRPWTDRTGQARQRLHGDSKRTKKGIKITLAHGVDYGVDLEFKYEKKYAIIYPTLKRQAPEVWAGLQDLFDKTGG